MPITAYPKCGEKLMNASLRLDKVPGHQRMFEVDLESWPGVLKTDCVL